jgi:SAM-dependent methyltransferase
MEDLAREDRELCDKWMCGDGVFDHFVASDDGSVTKTQREASWDVLTPEPAGSLCPFVPTTLRRVPRIVAFGSIGPNDVCVDLGCGDGSLLVDIQRASGCRCVGIDLKADLLAQAPLRAAHTEGVDEARMEWRCESFLDSNLSGLASADGAVIVIFYLTPDAIELIADHVHSEMVAARPHAFRVVSLCYHLEDERFLPPSAVDTEWALHRFGS